jgi:hypothetical protein
MTPPPRRRPQTASAAFAAFAVVVALASCGGGDDASHARAGSGNEEALPVPAQPRGSVTGMPDGPGPGDVPLAGAAPVLLDPTAPAGEGAMLPPLEDNPESGLAEIVAPPGPGALPTVADVDPGADAAQVVRAYYDALAAGDPATAYARWSDGGRSSGQTPEQFAAGFAGLATLSVDIGTPGRVEGAAGSQYVEIPVAVSATRADGSVQRQVGAYVLRRAMVDGADAAQRSWRISSAELHEVQP